MMSQWIYKDGKKTVGPPLVYILVVIVFMMWFIVVTTITTKSRPMAILDEITANFSSPKNQPNRVHYCK